MERKKYCTKGMFDWRSFPGWVNKEVAYNSVAILIAIDF